MLHHQIQGSAASPLVHSSGGPLSDQLWVDPGATDATISGASGTNGPTSGGLRPVGSLPSGAGLFSHPGSTASATGLASRRGGAAHPANTAAHPANTAARPGSIEGSAASPLVHSNGGPLSDQLWVNPGATDATISGASGTDGPTSGGLRPVGSLPSGAGLFSHPGAGCRAATAAATPASPGGH